MLKSSLQGDDRGSIKSALLDLEKASNEFVERRMNASVRKMMSGQGIDDVSSTMGKTAEDAVSSDG